ncbi:MAG: hypothetical protein ACREJ5_24040 [Geminicoccaceae bacterium]
MSARPGFRGGRIFWIVSPAGIVNPMTNPSENPGLEQGQRG